MACFWNSAIDYRHTLDDAFGRRIVSTMYTELNQCHMLLKVLPEFQYVPESTDGIYVNSSSNQEVPLGTFNPRAFFPRPQSLQPQTRPVGCDQQ
jgi:multidrug efflux pump subunit AcrB